MGKIKHGIGGTNCEVCGNICNECFEVHLGGEKHIFDSFECAMSALTPRCAYCKCRIVGHGIQVGDEMFCSYACANDGYVRKFEASVIMHEQAHS